MKVPIHYYIVLVLIAILMSASSIAMKDAQRGRAGGTNLGNPQPAGPLSPAQASFDREIYVQLGAFLRPEGAARRAAELKQLGYPVRIVRGADFQRVVVGPFAGETEARSTLHTLKQQGYEGYLRRDLLTQISSQQALSSPGAARRRTGAAVIPPHRVLAASRVSRAESRPASLAIDVPPAEALGARRKQAGPAGLAPAAVPSLRAARDPFGDAARGAQLLRERHCTTCHALGAAGGGSAPNLSHRSRRPFSPAGLAAMLWNHGPAVWQTARRRHLDMEPFTEQEMRDIYCYFYALRYFDPPGDAARGKRLFAAKHCNRCHDVRATAARPGPPVPLWKSVANPLLWAQQMSNHGTEAADQMRRMQLIWSQLTLQEMVDLLVYVENLPGLRQQSRNFGIGDPSAGEQLFHDRGCDSCHTIGKKDAVKIDLLSSKRREPRRPLLVRIMLFQWLRARPPQRDRRDRSLSSLAVAMWNHSPLLDSASRDQSLALLSFRPNEMAGLLAFLIQKGYFSPPGRASRGRKIFRKKSCDGCHAPAGPLPLMASGAGTGLSEVRLAAAPWKHASPMLAQTQGGGRWPALTDRDVTDLIAYLDD